MCADERRPEAFAWIKDRSCFFSWSGGKDSCLALHRAIRQEVTPKLLLTMLNEDRERTRGHNLPQELIEKQAQSLGVPLVFHATSWENYESVFLSALCDFSSDGIEIGVFGDIDLEEHREWIERVCSEADITPYLPLWKNQRSDLLKEFIESGFKATIVSVKDDSLDRRLLGRTLDMELLREMERAGIDVSGEGGEYHTAVTDGPIFSSPIVLKSKGRVFRDGSWFLELPPARGTISN